MPSDGDGMTLVTSMVGTSPAERELIESEKVTGPQSFSVYFPSAGTRAGAHFHPVDQYQVFIAGAGRLGSKPVRPVVVHYTDRFTPYGPIIADAEDGLHYLTVRMTPHSGVRPMPESRHERQELGGRHLIKEFDPDAVRDAMPLELIEPEDDGLSASVSRCPAGSSFEGSYRSRSGGQQLVALAGSLVCKGRAHAAPSIAAFGPGEQISDVSAGEEGALVLHLVFPDPSRPPRRERAQSTRQPA